MVILPNRDGYNQFMEDLGYQRMKIPVINDPRVLRFERFAEEMMMPRDFSLSAYKKQ